MHAEQLKKTHLWPQECKHFLKYLNFKNLYRLTAFTGITHASHVNAMTECLVYWFLNVKNCQHQWLEILTSHLFKVIGLMLKSFTSPRSWYMCSKQLSICSQEQAGYGWLCKHPLRTPCEFPPCKHQIIAEPSLDERKMFKDCMIKVQEGRQRGLKAFWSRQAAVDFTAFVQGFVYHTSPLQWLWFVCITAIPAHKKSIAIFPVQLGCVLLLSETSGSFSLAAQKWIRLWQDRKWQQRTRDPWRNIKFRHLSIPSFFMTSCELLTPLSYLTFLV